MLRQTVVTLGTVVLLLGASVAEAQTRGQGQRGQRQGAGQGFGGGGVVRLLATPEVQKELSVNTEQKGLIEDMAKDLAASRPAAGNREDFQNLSQEERQKRFDEIRKQGEEREKKASDMAKMILEPKQFERLGQLQLQSEGAVTALSRTDIAAKLDLNAEQKDKIAKIRESNRPERGAGGGGGNRQNQSQEDRQKAAAEARERREKVNADALAVLSPKQKESWEQLLGKKFDFPAPQGRRPGGGN